MAIEIYNSLSRQEERLEFRAPGQVGLYVCGPTVYDDPHLGHARSAVVFDVITRYLKAKGHAVRYVRNITDVDDRIIEKARQAKRDFKALGRTYAHRYHEALRLLHVCPPDAEPRATEYLGPMRDLILKLIQSAHAYPAGGNVYFAVESFKDYGKLSRRKVESLPLSADPADEGEKRHPADFALWKAGKPGEPTWPSPWGPGRPGWHIECAAMSAHLLGPTFDIHGGGSDLIFPHHENEIALSHSLFGKPPATYWIHNGLVYTAGEKMSKSLGNTLRLCDLLEIYRPEALRLFLLSKHYRHPIEFSHRAMEQASAGFERLCRFFWHHARAIQMSGDIGFQRGECWSRFCRAMDKDFNFPMALSVLFENIRCINRRTQHDAAGWARDPAIGVMGQVSDIDFICRQVLGIAPQPPAEAALKLKKAAQPA